MIFSPASLENQGGQVEVKSQRLHLLASRASEKIKRKSLVAKRCFYWKIGPDFNLNYLKAIRSQSWWRLCFKFDCNGDFASFSTLIEDEIFGYNGTKMIFESIHMDKKHPVIDYRNCF